MPAIGIGDTLQRYPLLCLLIPYIVGIGLADVLWPHVGAWWLYGIALGGMLLAVLCVLCTLRGVVWLSGVAACSFFLALGGAGYTVARQQVQYVWPSDVVVYEARLTEPARPRIHSVLCKMEVTALRDTMGWQPVRREVLAYMEVGDEASSLQVGDVVCFQGRIRAPRNFTADLDFDYARYVTMQGAAGTVYLPHGHWTLVGADSSSLGTRMLRLRHTLQTKYMYPAFSGDALGVLLALTLGDKRALSEEVRAAYSDAGVAHVLALSGLHVGVIYAMLAFLLRGIFRRRSLRWLREVLTIVVLWLFALMVGMSASVVRAVAMCTLYILSRWVSRESDSINVLSFAALLMLMVHPFYLFDVGFQLSFMAMVAILWLEPHLEQLFCSRPLHPVPAYLVGVVCMSLAAQAGTFPLVLYHFGTFPTYFLLTNLVVIPYLYIVLLLTIVWWALVLVGLPLALPLEHGVQFLVGGVNNLLACIGRWPCAVLRVEGFSAVAVLFAYLSILFFALFILRRWPRGAVLALVSLLGLLLAMLSAGV